MKKRFLLALVLATMLILSLAGTAFAHAVVIPANSPVNQPPVAQINWISPNPATEGTLVWFEGKATDPDRFDWVVSCHWQSSINGDLSTRRSFATRDLPAGTHIITFRVNDRHGLWSEEVSQTLVINAAADRPALGPLGPIFPRAEVGYANPELLVETGWLAQHLDVPGIVIIDVRDAAKYEDGHVPNAVNVSLTETFDPDSPLRWMVAPKERFEALMDSLGIMNETHVVIYDEGDQPTAARLFWTLEYYSHEEVSLLNGGYAKWIEEGREVGTGALQVTNTGYASTYTAMPDPTKLATEQQVLESLGKADVAIVDARKYTEYNGEEVYAERGGHIPGAALIEWKKNLTSDWGELPVFKSAEELVRMYEMVGVTKDKEVIVYCQGGVRSAHAYFTLRLLGYERIRNYDGSWEEWGNDPNVPITEPTAITPCPAPT